MKKFKHKNNPDEPVLDLEYEETDSQEQSGPVTVLGKTFANDDERRAYFREQLRSKLPELRKIEGFPIGTDDDIINLSDPPYYTACPNPWLNDFIEEWEEEKKQLETEGKRLPNIEVFEPYAADISEGKDNPIYLAHAYHTKVPYAAIMKYISHYTQPGDIIFDGFCGSGMTGVAANMCLNKSQLVYNQGIRHSICSDLAPIATNIAYAYNIPFKGIQFRQKAENILNQVEKELGWMFLSNYNGRNCKIESAVWSDVFTCRNCGHQIVYWDESVREANKSIQDEFVCPHCGSSCSKNNMDKVIETVYDPIIKQTTTINKKVPVKYNISTPDGRYKKDVDESDIQNLTKIQQYIISNPRTSKLLENGYNTSQPIRSNGVTFTHQFYTKRTFAILSRIHELISGDNLLLSWFTSSCLSTTKMNRFRFSGTGINAGTLFIPSLNWEFNPINTLRKKINAFDASQYGGRGNSIVTVLSATNLATIADSTIDYIFIDPPFGANIMYSEVNSIWEGWLQVFTNAKEEAIVNKAQQKELFDYQRLMTKSFGEFYRILKPGRWMTIEFSNTSAAVWNSIQTALQSIGFIVANVSALDKKQGTFKAVTTTTAVRQDLIISCFKPSDRMLELFKHSPDKTENVWDFVDELLSRLPVHIEKNKKLTTVIERSPKILYDRLISFYVEHGFPVPLNASEFQAGLRERYLERDGMFFTSSQATYYDDKRKRTNGFQPTLFFVDSEQGGIAWLNNELTIPQTYQDIQPKWMQAIKGVRKGDILPELIQILEENFIKESDGRWRRPNLQDDVDLEALRTKSLMREFKVYVEAANKPKGKIKEARTEALVAGFMQAYKDKDFSTIIKVAERIPQNLLQEDGKLLALYQNAQSHI